MYIKTEAKLLTTLQSCVKSNPQVFIRGRKVSIERKIKGCPLVKEIVFRFFTAALCLFLNKSTKKTFLKACKGTQVKVLRCSKTLTTQKIHTIVQKVFPKPLSQVEKWKLLAKKNNVEAIDQLISHFLEKRVEGNWIRNTQQAITYVTRAIQLKEERNELLKRLQISIHPYFCYQKACDLLVKTPVLRGENVREANLLLTHAYQKTQEPYLKNLLALLKFNPLLFIDYLRGEPNENSLKRVEEAQKKGFYLANLVGGCLTKNENKDAARAYYVQCPPSSEASLFFAELAQDQDLTQLVFNQPRQQHDLQPPSLFLYEAYQALSLEDQAKLKDQYIKSLKDLSTWDFIALQLLSYAYEDMPSKEAERKQCEEKYTYFSFLMNSLYNF